MKRIVVLLFAGTVCGLDDSTLSLFAKVDPFPSEKKSSSSFLQGNSVQQVDQSHMPFSAIQFERPGRRLPPVIPSSSLRENKSFIRVQKVHLHDAPEAGSLPPAIPDVFICLLPAGQNGLSVRSCDLQGNSAAVLSQNLACSSRVHPRTVADIFMGVQTAPFDLSDDANVALKSVQSMMKPVSLQVTFGSCDSPREDLPDFDLNLDYLVFVISNPLVESAAENLALATRQHSAFKAGLVFVDLNSVFTQKNLKSSIADHFVSDVETCAKCNAAQLTSWVPSGSDQVDWFVGRNDGIVKILLEPQQTAPLV